MNSSWQDNFKEESKMSHDCKVVSTIKTEVMSIERLNLPMITIMNPHHIGFAKYEDYYKYLLRLCSAIFGPDNFLVSKMNLGG
jgi:hypothetical protein